jgi:hypothetical protein
MGSLPFGRQRTNMLEIIAMILIALWVIGLVTGNVFSGAIHVLLGAGLVAAWRHHRSEAEARAHAQMISARSMAGAMGAVPQGRTSPKKSGPGSSTRPSAAA